jgi:ribonuclease HI
MSKVVNIFTDGGSRGNPGPAACAFVVTVADKVISSGAKSLGIATNNVAEYGGVLLALEWLEK